MRGRTIFGDLVPFGKVWRTGANANTKISFSDDVKVGGKELPAGTYALYTIPKENEWEVIFYKDANNWGNPQDWKEDMVAAKAMAEVSDLPFSMETFTIMLDELTNDSAMLNIIWEQTVASIKIEVPTEKRAMASIERVMKGPGAGDYFAAASYYHDEGKDLDKAYEWIKKAVEMGNPDAYWVLRRKSLIEADLGKKKEAIATAKLSLEKAEKAGNADYIKMNKESIAEWEN
jgi:TPR repeat protein